MLCYGSLSRLINTSSNPQVHPDCLRIVSFWRQNLSGPPRAHMDKGHASELRLQDPRGLTPASNAVSCDFSCPGTTSHPCHSKACFIPWGLWEEGGRSLATVSGAGSPSVWYGGDLGTFGLCQHRDPTESGTLLQPLVVAHSPWCSPARGCCIPPIPTLAVTCVYLSVCVLARQS